MFRYYVDRTIRNGPAMTESVHAVIAARLGLDAAFLVSALIALGAAAIPMRLLFARTVKWE